MSINSDDVYLFNPTCEYAVANGKTSWQPNRLLQKMESDLACLPMYFAKSEDFVLVDYIPTEKFLEKIQSVSKEIPSFYLKSELAKPSFQGITKNYLKPWGWSPAAHQLLSPLKENCSAKFKQSPVFNWKPEYKEIYSKQFALNILQILKSSLKTDYFISDHLLPEICTTKTQVEKLILKWDKIMIKAPWSSSGRGLQPVTKTPVHPKVWEKITGIFNEQGYAMVEPFLEKVLDFSFQFEMKSGKIEFLGISNFVTNKKGQYLGNSLNGLPENISNNVVEFQKNAIQTILNPLIQVLEQSKLAKYYEGNFGVDTLIFSDKGNELKINPCLEINVRQNMGLLSLHLEKLIISGKKGIYRTFYQPGSTFKQFSTEMEQKHPLKIINQKIESGFFALTEAKNESLFGAYIMV